MMGVTFNGSVTFNGPMFDIHDNENVTVVNEKKETQSEANQPQSIDEEQQEVVERLKPIFFGIEADAREFLVSIEGMKATQITAKVNQLVDEGKISPLSSHRDLWRALHDCGLYKKSESNWNQQVN